MADSGNKFRTGTVLCKFKKDLPYFDSEGNEIESLKGNPQFAKGVRAKLKYSTAGNLHKKGYLDILDKEKEVVNVKTVAKEATK